MLETYVSPAGSMSVSFTFDAPSGPLFFTVTPYVTVSPSLGVGRSTVLATWRSAETDTPHRNRNGWFPLSDVLYSSSDASHADPFQ